MPHRTEVDPNYVKNEKGDYEIVINTTACDAHGELHCILRIPMQAAKLAGHACRHG
jgi:hypothetical protein